MTKLEEYQYNSLVGRAANGHLTIEQEYRMNQLGKKKIEEKIAERKALEPPTYDYEFENPNG